MRIALKRAPERLSVKISGRAVAVAVRRNAQARRLILRLDAASGLPVVTLPARASLAQAERFVGEHVGWLRSRLGHPADLPFRDGSVFPLRGKPCRIEHRSGRGLVRLERWDGETILSVPGEAEYVERRVTDWLKRKARRDFQAAVLRHCERLGREPAGLRIGDAKSRWGSCTAAGILTFSWRLVFAPPHVLSYLAAHEVAHLAQMNHGPRFWAVVARLDPEHRIARVWLKQHGAGLHAIGRLRIP